MNDPDGRYFKSELRYSVGPDGQPIAYLARRFLQEPETFTLLGVVAMQPGERLDLFSARVQGVATAWWRIADAHRVIHPDELEDPPLQRLHVRLPEAGP
jgi:hypothetical protein